MPEFSRFKFSPDTHVGSHAPFPRVPGGRTYFRAASNCFLWPPTKKIL